MEWDIVGNLPATFHSKKKAAEEKAAQCAKEDEEKAQKEREAKQNNDKLEAKDKELHGEEENLQALVSEASWW